MKMKYLYILICVLAAGILWPLQAKNKKSVKPAQDKVYLVVNALTTTYDYTALRGTLTTELTRSGYTLVRSAQEADWTVQVTGLVGTTRMTEFGNASFYTGEVNTTIIIDRGAFAVRVYETTLTELGKSPLGFDEAVVEAYQVLAPKICQTLLQYLK